MSSAQSQAIVHSQDAVHRFVSYQTVGRLAALLDYLLIAGSCFAAGYLYHFLVLSEIVDFGTYVGIGNASALLFLLLSQGLYRTTSLISLRAQLRGILFNWTIVLFTLLLLLFLLKAGANHSRGALTIFSLLSLGSLVSSRFVICNRMGEALERGTLAGYPAIIIGEAECLKNLSRLETLQRFGAQEVRRFELLTGDQQRNCTVIDDAIETARAHHVDRVLLAFNWNDEPLRKLVCERLQALPLQVLLLPDRNITSILSQTTKQHVTDFTVEVQRPPLSAGESIAKRVLDLLLGGAILLSLLPLMAIVAVLVKLDSPGPVIFRQRRRGFNGREFIIYKFRTMKVLEDGEDVRQARRDDARITRLGHLLRATSIDELPQLMNVLWGQMSLVGPRPHATSHDDRYSKLIRDYAFRQHVKPGLTGWAQVHGFRGETAALELMERRIAFDVWYIKNFNIWIDLWILMLTCFEVIRRRNAY